MNASLPSTHILVTIQADVVTDPRGSNIYPLLFQIVSVDAIPDGWMGLDNGPESTELIQVTINA